MRLAMARAASHICTGVFFAGYVPQVHGGVVEDGGESGWLGGWLTIGPSFVAFPPMPCGMDGAPGQNFDNFQIADRSLGAVPQVNRMG